MYDLQRKSFQNVSVINLGKMKNKKKKIVNK